MGVTATFSDRENPQSWVNPNLCVPTVGQTLSLGLSLSVLVYPLIMTAAEQHCTILLTQERPEGQTREEICRDLEQPHDVPTKIKAIKTAIALLLSGEPMPR